MLLELYLSNLQCQRDQTVGDLLKCHILEYKIALYFQIQKYGDCRDFVMLEKDQHVNK